MKGLPALLLLIFVATNTFSQIRTEFSGVPSMKVSEGGLERTPENLDRTRAENLACVINETGGEYYWTSRENKRMVRIDSGAFLTYIAIDGAGYVRTIIPDFKVIASLMSPTEEQFDYVEHLTLGLRSVTYYGLRN